MLLLVLAAIGCYAMSLAPVTWVVISEIFPNRIRGAAVSVAVSSLWIACFILTYTFPFLNKQLGADLDFWIYAYAICAAGICFYKIVPARNQRQNPGRNRKATCQVIRSLISHPKPARYLRVRATSWIDSLSLLA